MKPTIDDAILLAVSLHKGQKDKAGEPYILHPLRVMLRLKTYEERMVGVLHDVLEDCGVTLQFLRNLGYNEKILEALNLITKLPKEKDDYESFILRIKKGGSALAIKVKCADLEDNMDISRIFNPTERDHKRIRKYHKAIKILKGG